MKIFQFETEQHYEICNLLSYLPPSYIYFCTINHSDKWLCQITSEFLSLEQLKDYMNDVVIDSENFIEFLNVKEL